MAHKTLRGRKSNRVSKTHIKAKIGKKERWLKKKQERESKKDQEENMKPAELRASKAPLLAADGRKLTKAETRKKTAMEAQHLAHYAPNDRMLFVGEGNFSFAVGVCRHLGEGACGGVYATAFDTESQVNRKYPDAKDHRAEVEKFGGTTLVGVDATRLHKVKEFLGAFKTIVFNFPHLGGGEADVDKSVADHRKLLHGFFASAIQCLSEDKGAKIHVALKTGEPYKSWKIAQTAQIASPGLDLQTAVPFCSSAFPTYAHRRTVGFDERWSKIDNEEIGKGAKVYVFGRRKQKNV